jgi:flagellar biosynthesis/type III secretory pathway chaperone
MDADFILAKLEQTLEDERVAIRRLDGKRVEACAAEKTSLVAELMALDAGQRKRLSPRFKSIVGRIRHNGVLLVHARGILADILRVKGAAMNFTISNASKIPAMPTGGRLSVRG